MSKLFMGFWAVFFLFSKFVYSYEVEEEFCFNKTDGPFFESVYETSAAAAAGGINPTPLMIGLTLIPGAAARGAGKYTHTLICCLCSCINELLIHCVYNFPHLGQFYFLFSFIPVLLWSEKGNFLVPI